MVSQLNRPILNQFFTYFGCKYSSILSLHQTKLNKIIHKCLFLQEMVPEDEDDELPDESQQETQDKDEL